MEACRWCDRGVFLRVAMCVGVVAWWSSAGVKWGQERSSGMSEDFRRRKKVDGQDIGR